VVACAEPPTPRMRTLIRARRSLRGSVPLALALSLLWPAAVAQAAPSCSFDAVTGIVSVTAAHGEVPTVSRLGDAIAVDGVACGTATVTNTESIDLPFPDDPDSDTVVVDLVGGPLAPGATDEGDGSSEIEIDVTRGDGSFDTLRILGSSGSDVVTTDFFAVNLNADESVADSDVTVDDIISLDLIGGAGDDDISLDPFSAFAVMTVIAGDGDDRLTGRHACDNDVLDAGPGRDVADYSSGNEIHLRWDGSGNARILTGCEEVVANVEVAILTDGGDTVSYEGDAVGETFLGRSFDTVIVTEPSFVVSPDDRIIHGGPGVFDWIQFDLAPSQFVHVGLSRHTLGGFWHATYDGFEYVFGGPSDNRFVVDRPDVYPTIVGEGGHDVLDLFRAVDGFKVTLGQKTFGDGPWLRTFDLERVSGSPFADVILGPRPGREGPVALYGFGGSDLLRGGDHPDLLRGGPGADRVRGRYGADTLWGSAGPDVLRGEHGHDEIRGGAGNDVLLGGPGADACLGGSGSDRIDCET
jgi:Ca2+-binding RTX toxin-like protein